MKKLHLFIPMILGIILATASCKKEEVKGPKGDQGDPGIGGNANITSTSFFFVNSSMWLADSASMTRKVTLNQPIITQNVIDKGSVKVYRENDSTISELPIVNGDLFTQYGFELGKLHLEYVNIEGAGIPDAPATAKYRLVVISEAN